MKNDRINNNTNYESFVNWHKDHQTPLSFIERKKVEKISSHFGLDSTDVALWENSYAVIFDHGKDGSVRIKVVLESEREQFDNIKKYFEEVERQAETVDLEKLLLIPPPLAENWKGYTGCPKDRAKIHDFIRKLLRKIKKEKGIVLDAAAGIGNEAICLMKDGFRVRINEFDTTFRTILKQNIASDKDLKKMGITLEHVKHNIYDKDWSKLHERLQEGSVDAVLVLGNSLCMVTEDGYEQRRKCIKQFFRVLSNGGMLIVDERNFPKILKKLEANETVRGRSVMYPGKEVDCVLRHTEDDTRIIFDFTKQMKPVGELPVACLREQELWDLLNDAGFRDIKIYSDLKLKTPPDEDADFYTYVAFKREETPKHVGKRHHPKRKTKAPLGQAIAIGNEDERSMVQWGIIGKSGKKLVKFDLNAPHIVCVCGKPGSGKGYTIGVICEMLISESIRNLSNILKKATVIVFHKPEKDSKSEFWSMARKNDVKKETEKLERDYGVTPQSLIPKKNVRIFVDPSLDPDKAKKIGNEYDFDEVYPIYVNPSTLEGKEWEIFLSTGRTEYQEYDETLSGIIASLESFDIQTVNKQVTEKLKLNQQKLAVQRLEILQEYLVTSETQDLVANLILGGVNILDFRKAKRRPRDVFSIMTLILGVLTKKALENRPFVFVINEAHSFFKNGVSKPFVNSLYNLIRMRRHGLNWLLLDTQLPRDLDPLVMELADVRILHRLNSGTLNASKTLRDICGAFSSRVPKLKEGHCIIKADISSEGIDEPIPVSVRPRLTKHGGATQFLVRK